MRRIGGVTGAPTPSPRPIVILGPTAGGKSELAVQLAEALAERGGGVPGVIGADSMQVYRHLDAGTAKPTPDQRRRVEHHGIDVVEPTQRFTVHDWLTLAEDAMARIQSSGAGAGAGAGGTPIVVGGTNLYLKALLEGLFNGPGRDDAYRAELEKVPDTFVLHQRLARVDPDAAQRIDPNDRQRITRALEVFHLTGQPISALQTQWRESEMGDRRSKIDTSHDLQSPNPDLPRYRHDPILLGLRWPADAINTRINLRVKAMFHPEKVSEEVAAAVVPAGESLPDEVRRLADEELLGTEDTRQASEAIGYKQCLAAMRRQMSWDDAFEKTKIATRRFAKQQRTWLKRFVGVHWIDMPADDPLAHALDAIAAHHRPA